MNITEFAKMAGVSKSAVSRYFNDGCLNDEKRENLLTGMGIKCGDTVTFQAEGEDEEAAEKAVEKFMTENL